MKYFIINVINNLTFIIIILSDHYILTNIFLQQNQLKQQKRMSTEIQTKLTKSGQRIFYSLTEKQSESKITWNERLFVLVDEKYLGYITQFNKKDLESSCDVNKIKKRIPIKDIRRINCILNEITMLINQYDKNNKLKSLKWVFRMATEKLADTWTQILERQNSPFPSRKATQQREKEQVEPSPDRPMGKNPSIKQLIKDAQVVSKRKEDKEVSRIINEELKDNVKQMNSDSDKTKRTFSFRGPKQEDIDIYSPPKEQARINNANSMVKKAQSLQPNLSLLLEKGIDLKAVENQLELYKSRSKKQKTPQFRQLNQNLTNRQKQVQNMKFTNYFRQVPADINDGQFLNFYCFCQMKIKELLLQDFDNEASTKNWIQYILNTNGVKVQILPSDLKQIPGNSKICDEGLLKLYLNKAKSMDYIWKIVANDQALSQVFRMPMTCMAEFQGVLAYFICTYTIPNQNNFTKNQDFSQYFQRFSQLTKINKIALQNPSSIQFIKISNKQFLIAEVGEFLPRLTSINCMIRPQMFFQSSGEFSTVQGYLSKTGKKEQQQQNKYFKKSIEEAISYLSKNLDRLEEYVIHPSQFSHLMHLHGLNVRCLNQIQKKVQNVFIKSILKTEAAFRSFKVIYRKKMQEHLLKIQQISQSSNKKSTNYDTLLQNTKSLLNILLSNSQDSNVLWDIIALHSQINYMMPVSKKQINKGYLFLGLQLHLGIKVNTIYASCQKIFAVDAFANDVQFVPKIKPCHLFWIDEHLYNLEESKKANEFIRRFRLRQKHIPFHIYQNKNILNKIYDIISLYYGPNDPELSHLKIYQQSTSNSDLTLYYCRRKMAEIKWWIKSQSQITSHVDIGRIEEKLSKLKESLAFYYGSYHPFYSQIYQILINLYERQKNYEKVHEFIKVNTTNIIQLCGGNTMHLRLANNYYQKGEFHQNWQQTDQAIANYKKAKNILEFNSYTQARQYAIIEIKLAALHLSKYKDIDAYKLLESCLEAFCNLARISINLNMARKYLQKLNPPSSSYVLNENQISPSEQLQNYSNIVTCLQLMNRCIISDPNKITTLIQVSLLILQNCIAPQYPMNATCLPDAFTAKIIKVLIQNYFDQHKRQISRLFISYIELLCDEIHVGHIRSVDPINSLTTIKEFIINNIFMETLNGFNNKSETCYAILHSNPIEIEKLTNKNIENFHKLIKSILVVVGEGFILGVLNDKIQQETPRKVSKHY